MSRSMWIVASLLCLTLLSPFVFNDSIFAQSTASVMYGVHDAGDRDSQFFRLDLDSGVVEQLGPVYEKFDVEAIDIHPDTGVLYGIAGGGGNQDGSLFVIDKDTGDLTLVGDTSTGGSREIVSASFHPDGTLWAFQQNVGLLTVNLIDASTTLQWSAEGQNVGKNWEGLAWDFAGDFLYGSQGGKLYRWDPASETAERLCGRHFLPSPAEALDFRPDGTLIGGWHNAPDSTLRVFEADFNACRIDSTDYGIPYNDVESIAFETMAPPTPTPSGHDKLTAHVFIDFGCDGSFQGGVDISLSDVPVTLSFSNGASSTLLTTSQGMVYFAGFDASDGVTVSADLPASYSGFMLGSCSNSPTTVGLPPSEFQPGAISHKHVQFTAALLGEMPDP
ncbi:MAG: hypothetical protein ACE5LU_21470 [Anaerolineae bacterium]